MDTVTSQLHDPCEEDLLNLKKYPVDEEKYYTTNRSLYTQIKGNDCQIQNNLKDNNMSASNIIADKSSALTLPVELIEDNTAELAEDNTDTSIESQESIDLCNNIHYQECSKTMSPTNQHDKHLQTSEYDGETGTPKTESDIGHLNTSTNNTILESAKTVKIRSMDFQVKNTVLGLSKPDTTRNGRRKTVPQMPKSRKLGSLYETEMVLHKLDFVEEESLSEQEESSEDDNLDNSLTFSRDRLDHRKERHQYVSDQLDPDVLHLLEMHLRKQQLVEIKEEREEELLDVHINKEKSRSETFKLLRNISPVLDMVLEEPELEHSGDTGEGEDVSKTPSDIDSDESSNSCAVELGLMESLQHDLMSKSSKIDKHEIATILQAPTSDILTRENKGKHKAAVCDNNNGKIRYETIKNEEPKTLKDGTGYTSNLQTDELQKPIGENVTSDLISESTPVENGHDVEVASEGDPGDSWKESVAHKDTETENDGMGEPDHACQCTTSRAENKDLNLDVNNEEVSDTEACVTDTGIAVPESNGDAFTETESECVKTKDASNEQCPTLDGNPKPHDITVPSLDDNVSLPTISKITDSHFPNQTDNFITGEVFTEQHDDIDNAIGGESTDQTDLKEELKQSVTKGNSSEPSLCSPAEMSTLRTELEEKILSLLQKAHAADCRSSHLQAGAELLWKESIELRNECKSLSKEAAELLSLFKKPSMVHRQQRRQIPHRTNAVGSLSRTTDTTPSSKETLNFGSKNDSRNINKGEDQLQFLSKKYNFLREEAPEIMRELHILQQDLKSLPSHHSKPMSILYSLLWGGLMTGGALLLAWWSTKQLG
ncbi:uncharacterized protein [Dendropsophus ebraccatus]|uniref:uncharacterized protein n=1 Tax=Dendropsophus ebraccatus TaxID=150705 RepID=UPI00383155E8